MTLKIRISYEQEAEAAQVMQLLKPVMHLFNVKKPETDAQYKHVYLTTRKSANQ